MYGIGYNVNKKFVNPQINSSEGKIYEAIVTRRDPPNNCCDIVILNLSGQEQKNVPVRLYDDGTTWFPKAAYINSETVSKDNTPNEDCLVSVFSNEKGSIIIGPSLTKKRRNHELSEDITSDSDGADPGGTING